MQSTTETTKQAAGRLNELLREEISAVETYRQALEKVQNPPVRSVLEDCESCHAARLSLLAQKVQEFGEEPVRDSGIWGAFARLLETGANAFGDKAVVSILEEYEDRDLADYRKVLEEPNPQIHEFVKDLLPRQEGTHSKMANLKHSFH